MRGGIIEIQQARRHLQFAVALLQLQHRPRRQWLPVAVAAHGDAVEAQRGGAGGGIGSLGVHQGDAAVGGGRHQHAVGAQVGGAIQELLAGRSILHAKVAQVAAQRLPAVEATRGGDPDPMARIDHHSRRGHRRHAVARLDPVHPRPGISLAAVLLQPSQPLQPDHLRPVEGQRMHGRTGHRCDRAEFSRGGIEREHAVAGRQPGLSAGRDRQRVQIQFAEAACFAGRQVAQDAAAHRLALLHAAAGGCQPDAAVRRQREVGDHAGWRRIGGVIGAPFVDRAIRADAHQARAGSQPQPSGGILRDRGRLAPAEAVLGVLVQRAHLAVRTQLLHLAVQPAKPDTAVARAAHGPVHAAAQAVGRPLQLGQVAPVGTQVAQATPGHRHPQGGIALPAQRHDDARDVRAAGLHRLRWLRPMVAPEATLAGDPVVAAGVGDHRHHRIRAVEHGRPVGLSPTVVLVQPDALRGPDPQSIGLGR